MQTMKSTDIKSEAITVNCPLITVHWQGTCLKKMVAHPIVICSPPDCNDSSPTVIGRAPDCIVIGSARDCNSAIPGSNPSPIQPLHRLSILIGGLLSGMARCRGLPSVGTAVVSEIFNPKNVQVKKLPCRAEWMCCTVCVQRSKCKKEGTFCEMYRLLWSYSH